MLMIIPSQSRIILGIIQVLAPIWWQIILWWDMPCCFFTLQTDRNWTLEARRDALLLFYSSNR
jgi:hypothetical protein